MSYYDILLAKNLSGGGGGGDITVESLSVTENGTYTAPSGKAYSPVSVNVPNPSTGSISITENGTYDVTAKASAVVNVPNSYTASDEGKVVSSGALVSQTSQSIDTNGTYDTTLKNSVTVNVSGGGGVSNIITGEFNFDTSGAHDIAIPYNGNGYITDLCIYPKNGDSSIYTAVWSGAFVTSVWTKDERANAPDYTDASATSNFGSGSIMHKYTTATNYRASVFNNNLYKNVDAGYAGGATKIRSKNVISVYVSPQASTQGYLPEVDYCYIAKYSS